MSQSKGKISITYSYISQVVVFVLWALSARLPSGRYITPVA